MAAKFQVAAKFISQKLPSTFECNIMALNDAEYLFVVG
jgi:hypothetical protein